MSWNAVKEDALQEDERTKIMKKIPLSTRTKCGTLSGNVISYSVCRLFFCKALILLLSFPLIPSAQVVAEEIFVVNIQEVIAKSTAGESLKKKMEAEALKRRSQIEAISQEIVADEEKLQKQASLLAPTVLEEKKDALLQRRKELARKVQDEKESLERQSSQAIAKLVGKIREMIPQVVKDDSASVVMERDPQVVLYASPDRDITAQLIELLNEAVVSL